MKKIQIAIDGPASSGKSTVAKIIARNLDLIYLDTGAMYRVATFVALQKETNDAKEIIEFIEKNPISFMNGQKGQEVLMGSENVTEVIRTNEVTNTVSKISAMTKIREFMVAEQQRIAKNGGIIMDGRDIGTVVLPHADLKIYQIASVETRAKRRYLENKERGLEADLETIKKEIEQRDYQDMHRAISPLKKADDAIELDTSNMTLEEVVDQVLTLINKTREE